VSEWVLLTVSSVDFVVDKEERAIKFDEVGVERSEDDEERKEEEVVTSES
jgi:hypothetical protein